MKTITTAVALALAVCCLAGCAQNGASSSASASDAAAANNKLSIVTTVFPEYDWMKQILGEKADDVDLTLLLDNGTDLHSYQPTTADIAKISECDMFVYVGGESDEWVKDVLAQAGNKDMQVVNLVEALGDKVKEEEIVEGMQEEGHGHAHSHSHAKEVKMFEDGEAQDRSLADWAGRWQSGYPLLLEGSLDDAFEAMAARGDMTAAEYKDYYTAGYKTDIAAIAIDGDTISYTYEDGRTARSAYEYKGYVIHDWSESSRAALYRFEALDKESGVPAYIEFNDHMIEPAKAEHFHIRMSNESFDEIHDLDTSWPTFWPAEMSADEVCEHLAGHDEEEVEYDEHVWLSLKNAQVLVDALADALGRADAGNVDAYRQNAASYKQLLAALDSRYRQAVKDAARDTVIFGDRFPFRYLVDDYGLNYHAAFVGCSAETEASFETISFLAGKVDELSIPAIFTIENSDRKIARTIRDNTQAKDQEILVMDSLQSTTSADIASGASYLSAMEGNLDALTRALA